jgi:streptogramin lyase
MSGTADGLGRQVAAQKFADWADRIDAGEVPQQPKRPNGIEQNVVITQWEWGDQFTYAHDEIATDKRNPQLNPFGKVYGVDLGNDFLVMTDPVNNVSSRVHVPTENGFSTKWCDQTFTPGRPPDLTKTVPDGFCTWNVYVNPANPHNPMIDNTGKVWMTTQIRREWDADLPDFCVNNPNGFDTTAIVGVPHHRQLGYFDPATNQFVLLDTCFGTHHLEFDNNGVLWLSGDSFVIGWLDPSKLDLTKSDFNLPNAEGWSKVEVDSNGDGTPDTQLFGFHYGININPVDGSVWTGVLTSFPGRIERYDGKTDTTGKHEAYEPPFPYHGPRGVDVDTNGIVWVGLGGSGTLASFDRNKCATTAGTGNQCPEGWTIYQYKDTPQMVGVTDPGTADFHYLIFVDQHNTLGLGANAVVLTGTGSDSLIVFDQTTKKFSIIRIPYPLSAYMRGLDGRIDDPNTDWKGRGLWADYGIDPLKHTETGIGQIYHVQLRPSPLAQ